MAFENVDRLRVSALSRENKDFAYSEEILVHKSTGQFLLKTKDGRGIISVDSILRQKQAMNEIKSVADVNGIYGILYESEIDNILFPEVITDSNIITSEIEIFPDSITDFIINIDIDTLLFDGPSSVAKLDIAPMVELVFSLRSDENNITDFTIVKFADDINKSVITKQSMIPEETGENISLYLKSLKLVNNPDNMGVNKLHILHNILFLF